MSKSKRQNRTKTLLSVRKKTWHNILSPASTGKQVLGQSLVGEASELLNKTIAVNAMNLTGDMKKQQVTVTFKVTDIKDGCGVTSFHNYEVNGAYIKRMVKRRRNKLDMSFNAITKDNFNLVVKPILLTKSLAKGSTCTQLRKKTQESIIKLLKTLTYEQVFMDLLNYKLQNTVKNDLKKIYPVKTLEIRFLGGRTESGTPAAVQNESIPEPVEEKTKEATEKTTEKPKKERKPKAAKETKEQKKTEEQKAEQQ